MGWLVDGRYVSSIYRDELEAGGFVFYSYHFTGYSDLSMIAPAIESRNGTEIQCEAYNSADDLALSEVARLWIVGESH